MLQAFSLAGAVGVLVLKVTQSGCAVSDLTLRLLGIVEVSAMVEVGEINNARGGGSLFIPLSGFTFKTTPHFAPTSLVLVRPCGGQHLRCRRNIPH